MVFRSVWDRLCQQLFGAIPPGMDTEDILPDITIWQEGVILQEEEGGEFSFTVTTSGEEAPKAQDVILYKGIFYIVGQVGDDDDETQQAGPQAGEIGTDPHNQQVTDDTVPSGAGEVNGGEQSSTNTGEQATEPVGDNTVPSDQEPPEGGSSSNTHIENPSGGNTSRDDGDDDGGDEGREDLSGRIF